VVLEEAKDVAADAKVDQDADVQDNADIQGRTAESQAEINKIDLDHDNKGKGILVEEPKPLKKQAQIKQDEKYARELEGELNRTIDWDENVVGFKMDYFKGISYDDIRPVFEKYFDSNMDFLQKTKEQMDEDDSRTLKRLNETQE
nr:hypothetical protein [Tanacetum cinerariifolium]